MKNLIIFMLFPTLLLLSSCLDNDFEIGPHKTDAPPAGMFNSTAEYCRYEKVYIEPFNVKDPVYFGNWQYGYSSYYSQEMGTYVRNYFSQDYYKISAMKYFGHYAGEIYVSLSVDYYLVSGQDLSYIKEAVNKTGSAIVRIDGRNFDSQWQTISGIEN